MLNHLQASIYPYPQARIIDNVLTLMVSQSLPLMPAQLSANYAVQINNNSLRMSLPTLETSSFYLKMLFHSLIMVAILLCHPNLRHSNSKCKVVVIAELSQERSMVKMELRLKDKFNKIGTSVSLLSTKYSSLLTSIKMATINRYLIEVRTLNKR